MRDDGTFHQLAPTSTGLFDGSSLSISPAFASVSLQLLLLPHSSYKTTHQFCFMVFLLLRTHLEGREAWSQVWGERARKAFKHLKGAVKFQVLIEDHASKNQALNTLNYIHSWSKIQAEIRARRLCMVTEGRLKQKKLENQLKVDSMLQELEMEWCGGSDTMEEILMRIQQREAAAVKRERALAYAFSHQWRANSSQYLGQTYYEVGGKESWGWSWTERWIAARPWEIRVQSMPVKPMKVLTKMPIRAGKVTDNMATKTTVKMANTTPATGEGKKMPDPNAEQERAKELTPLQCLSEF